MSLLIFIENCYQLLFLEFCQASALPIEATRVGFNYLKLTASGIIPSIHGHNVLLQIKIFILQKAAFLTEVYGIYLSKFAYVNTILVTKPMCSFGQNSYT